MTPGNKKKKTMIREEAVALYQDMQRTMNKVLKNTAEYEKDLNAKGSTPSPQSLSSLQAALRQKAGGSVSTFSPNRAAISLLVVCGVIKLSFSMLDMAGITKLPEAQATSVTMVKTNDQPFSREEMKVLTSLDSRRAELQERSKKLQGKEDELTRRDQEFGVRVSELRELSSKLKLERDKDEKKRNSQLDQLANVYIAMNPEDAAQLLEQLDETIALSLMERMPEKRMGQILPLMSPDRALRVTKMLTR